MYNLEKTINDLRNAINKSLKILFEKGEIPENFSSDFAIEVPADKSHGDLSANGALVSAKSLKDRKSVV
mgnify:FL=1